MSSPESGERIGCYLGGGVTPEEKEESPLRKAISECKYRIVVRDGSLASPPHYFCDHPNAAQNNYFVHCPVLDVYSDQD
jgi:hypothetical protein